jgi:L-ascorbate metabolism protein UlaG (beta-lactamase superfamily)
MHLLQLMNLPPNRSFKLGKLRFIANLVRESLFTRMQGRQFAPVAAAPGQLGITWIGHSSFLLDIDGQNLLIDPVFATFLVVLKRRRRPGVALRHLPPVDVLLLTHAHMDHLNIPSLRRVLRNNRRLGAPAPVAIVPNGVADLIDKLGFREIRPLPAWQSTKFGTLTITATPARHWGARYFNDTWRGYGGYVIGSPTTSVYHCGDSASFPGFAEIGQRLKPAIALLPIGAYYPDSFRSVHTSPEDAWQAFEALGSHTLIPMHYGTFRLSLEPMDEPPLRLAAAAAHAGRQGTVLLLQEGRTHLYSPVSTSQL